MLKPILPFPRRHGALARALQIGVLGAGGAALAFNCLAQELGIPQASDSNQQRTQAQAASKDAPAYLMASFTATADNKLSLFSSNDGVHFTSLASEAYAPAKHMLRDPSIVRHKDGWYYVVHTTNAQGADFAITRSKDL